MSSRISAFIPALRPSMTLFIAFFLFIYTAIAGHRIEGTIAGYSGQKVLLAMLYGGNQYVVDSAVAVNGHFNINTVYDLESGVYFIVLPPSQSFLILVEQGVDDFKFSADAKDINGTMRFENSPDNTIYYDYLRFFESKRDYIEEVKKQYDAQKSEQDKAALLAKMQQLKKDILDYQTNLVKQHPGTLTAAMVQCELPVELPAFDGSPEEIQMKKYLFQKSHFFDHVDLADERLIRAPKNVLVDRVEYYLDQLTVQHPDSIIASVDEVLAKSEKTPESYRFLLSHIFNRYREAKKMGMDAVFVHIAENYIATGKAPWIEAKERQQVLDGVKMISPTLIGKQAPNFTVQTADGKNIALNDIRSAYTVLFFWSPNCTHCQQSMPALNQFHQAYKDKGVQVFAVCTKLDEQEKNCWDYLDKNQMSSWINASDQSGGNSQIHTQYNLKTTPKIFVLDADKTILAKDMGVEHLEEVMKRLVK